MLLRHVDKLTFHLPNEYNVVFDASSDLNDAVQRHIESVTKFPAWMKCNCTDSATHLLTHVEFPCRYVWKSEKKNVVGTYKRAQCQTSCVCACSDVVFRTESLPIFYLFRSILNLGKLVYGRF